MAQTVPSEVHFSAYRAFIQRRNVANNGVMALAAGSQLSSHLLKLTEGSARTLNEIFPQVPGVKHFNLKSEHALSELSQAELLLAAMAIPFHLGLFEGYVADVTALLRDLKIKKVLKLSNREEATDSFTSGLAKYLGSTFPPDTTSVLNLLKSVRNDLLHQSGIASKDYASDFSAALNHMSEFWGMRPSGSLLSLTEGGPIALNMPDLILTLAVVKKQAREVNWKIQNRISLDDWAHVAVGDYLKINERKPLNLEQHLRKCIGFTTTHYGALQIPMDAISTKLANALK